MMLNVLVLASWYPNKEDPFNGDFVERHTKAAALYTSIKVVFVKKSDSLRHGEELIEKSVEGNLVCIKAFYGCKHPVRIIEQYLSNRIYNTLQRKLIKQIIEEYGLPSIVHVQMAMKAGPGALFIKKKYGVPYVVTENWTGYYSHSVPALTDYPWWFRRITRLVLRNADLFLPVTADLGRLVARNVVPVRFEVVPNVVDLEKFYFKPRKSIDVFRFFHASYLNYQKNPEAMLRSAAALKREGYKFELLLVGRKAPDLEALAVALGLGSTVRFKDVVTYEQVGELMRESDALLLFSRFENLPCIVLEALCSGIPVVSSRVGGISEVVNDTNGFLVNGDVEEELVSAMKGVIEKYTSFDRPAIAKAASEKFGYHEVGKLFFDVYKQVISATKTNTHQSS